MDTAGLVLTAVLAAFAAWQDEDLATWRWEAGYARSEHRGRTSHLSSGHPWAGLSGRATTGTTWHLGTYRSSFGLWQGYARLSGPLYGPIGWTAGVLYGYPTDLRPPTRWLVPMAGLEVRPGHRAAHDGLRARLGVAPVGHGTVHRAAWVQVSGPLGAATRRKAPAPERAKSACARPCRPLGPGVAAASDLRYFSSASLVRFASEAPRYAWRSEHGPAMAAPRVAPGQSGRCTTKTRGPCGPRRGGNVKPAPGPMGLPTPCPAGPPLPRRPATSLTVAWSATVLPTCRHTACVCLAGAPTPGRGEAPPAGCPNHVPSSPDPRTQLGESRR